MKIFPILSLAGAMLTGCTLREVSVGYSEQPRHFYDDEYVYHDGYPYRDDVVYVPGVQPPGQVVVVREAPRSHAVVVRQAPPPPYAERIPPRPGPNYVWLPGYWAVDRDYNRWVWVAGSWQRPPRRNAVWVEPRWQRQGDEFRFSMGFWR
jgi:hypothetical protein